MVSLQLSKKTYHIMPTNLLAFFKNIILFPTRWLKILFFYLIPIRLHRLIIYNNKQYHHRASSLKIKRFYQLRGFIFPLFTIHIMLAHGCMKHLPNCEHRLPFCFTLPALRHYPTSFPCQQTTEGEYSTRHTFKPLPKS